MSRKNHLGWGGAREGSGRRPINLSDKEKKKLVKSARDFAKKTGKSVWDVLMMHVYNWKEEPRASVAAIKIYQDAMIVRESHRTVEMTEYGPVLLPVQDDDPAGVRVEETKH